MSLAWVDGRYLDAARAVPVDDGAFRAGHALFETIGAVRGKLPLWPRHLARLAAGAGRLRIECAPPPELAAAAEELLAMTRQQDGVLRLTLSAGGPGPQPRWIMTTRSRGTPGIVPLVVALDPLPDDWPFAALKCAARPHYAVAFAAARAAGAADALLLDRRRLVQETTTCNVVAELDGALVTPRASGRFLPGIARALLLENATVEEAELPFDALARCRGLWVTNAVHGVRPAALAGGPPPGDPDGTLAHAWQQLVAGG